MLATACGRIAFEQFDSRSDAALIDVATDIVAVLDAVIDAPLDGSSPLDAPDDAALDAAPIDAPIDAPPDAFVAGPGCADGTRDAFRGALLYPNVAGCSATWSGPLDLRASPTAIACGNDVGAIGHVVACAAPADACASGWHICSTNDDVTELTARINAVQCANEPGTYVAAIQHCTSYPPCDYTPPRGCAPGGGCAEPVCCGAGCRNDQACRAGAYPDPDTRVASGTSNGCAALLSSAIDGVLCCQ